MKRKIYVIIITLLVIVSVTTVTVLAKTLHSDWIAQQMDNGYTETDAYSLLAIVALSEQNVPSFVEQKYRALGDWEKVAEYYGIDVIEFHEFVESQMRIAQELAISDDIYAEMKAAGMTDEDCIELSRLAHNAQFDIEIVWEAHQDGKTVDDLIQERTATKNAQSQAATDLAFGKITEKEYVEAMKKISPDMPMSEILEFATQERREWMRFRKAASGITDAEIALAEKAGMTDFFAICRMKETEEFSELTFVEMVGEVQKGIPVDKVISDNFSASKVEAARTKDNTVTE